MLTEFIFTVNELESSNVQIQRIHFGSNVVYDEDRTIDADYKWGLHSSSRSRGAPQEQLQAQEPRITPY